jgi:hypothetical protein
MYVRKIIFSLLKGLDGLTLLCIGIRHLELVKQITNLSYTSNRFRVNIRQWKAILIKDGSPSCPQKTRVGTATLVFET